MNVSLSRGSCSYGAVYVRPGSSDYAWWNFTLPPVTGQVRDGSYSYHLPPGSYQILFHRVPGCQNGFSVRVDRPGSPPQTFTGDSVSVTLGPEDTLWITARY